MFISKLKMAAAILVTVAVTASGAGVLSYRALATEKQTTEPKESGPDADFSLVDKRIQEMQPTDKEKRFDKIGWAKGLREAERLAKENNRPVFLFCNVGQLDIGRC